MAEVNKVQPGPSGYVETDDGGTRCGTCEYLRGGVCTNKTLNADNARYKFAQVRDGFAVVDPRNACCNEWEHREGKASVALETAARRRPP